MSAKPLLKESFLILNICGINPTNQNIWSRVKAVTIICLLTYMVVELILQFVFNWRGWEFVDELITCAALIQMIYKAIYITCKTKDLSLAVNNIEQFLSWNKLPNNVQQEINSICEYTIKSIKIFATSCFCSVLTNILKPLCIVPLRTLPYDTYHPKDRNDSSSYETMYLLQIFNATIGCICVIGFDCLFVSLMVYIICELKILKQMFSDVKIDAQIRGDETSCLREVALLVDHHNYVLGSIKNLNKLYSLFLLNQFFSSILCVCSGLLCMVAMGFPPDLQHFFKYTSFLCAVLSQLLIYCIVGEALIAESESLSDAVFETKWWVKTQPKLRKAYVMVIRRAQKTEKLSAGGMLTLRLHSFTSIIRFAFSFFTMAQAMYIRGNNRTTS